MNCRRQLAQVREVVPELERLDVGVAGIVGQKAARVAKYLLGHPLPFPILVDSDRAVIKAYGVYHRIGLTAWNIARPAIFVLDREGVVGYSCVGRSQVDLPRLGDMLAQARIVGGS